jgi:hypothetical protein
MTSTRSTGQRPQQGIELQELRSGSNAVGSQQAGHSSGAGPSRQRSGDLGGVGLGLPPSRLEQRSQGALAPRQRIVCNAEARAETSQHRFAYLPLAQHTEQQRALRHQYAQWAEAAEVNRRNQLGDDHYSAGPAIGLGAAPVADRYQSRISAVTGELGGKLRAAAIEAFQASFSSGPRSGGSNAADTVLRNAVSSVSREVTAGRGSSADARIAELDNPLDLRLLSGAIGGGLSAMVAEGFVKALDRARADGGKLSLKPVDVKALVPKACPVRVEEVNSNGVLRYQFSAKEPSAVVHEEASLQKTRDSLQHLQKLVMGESFGLLIHPPVAGGFAVARNGAAGNLMNSGGSAGVFALGASCMARLTSRSVESLLQISASTAQNDLAPGNATQKLPLFRLDRAKPTGAMNQPALPQRLVHEVGQLVRESVAQRAASLLNATVYSFGNATANAASTALVGLYAQSLVAVRKSVDTQQFISSAVNDMVWQVCKNWFKGSLSDFGASIDAKTQQQACGGIEHLAQQLTKLQDHINDTAAKLRAVEETLLDSDSDAQTSELGSQKNQLEAELRRSRDLAQQLNVEAHGRLEEAEKRLGVSIDIVQQLRETLPPAHEAAGAHDRPLFVGIAPGSAR